MPVYEFHCPECGRDFERLVRGETRVVCPACESRKVERRMSVTARPAGSTGPADFSGLGPPGGGCCGGGGCGCH
jgi:putative FmdB family regulatory protein